MTPQDEILPPCICGISNCAIPFGECHCGCGGKTAISPVTSRERGRLMGYPVRYLVGHATIQPRVDFSGAQAFKIGVEYCMLVALTRGFFAIVNVADYEWLSAWLWYTKIDGDYIYAARTDNRAGKTIWMHNEISGLQGNPGKGDHRNGVTLDNRRWNLRPAGQAENARNSKLSKNNTSGRRGTSFRAERRLQYTAHICVNGSLIHLGSFATLEESDAAYRIAAAKHFGEFRRES